MIGIVDEKLSKRRLTADMLLVALLGNEMVQRPEPDREFREILMGWDMGHQHYPPRSRLMPPLPKKPTKSRAKEKAARKTRNRNNRRLK